MMKKITLLFVMLFLSFAGYAQLPENFEGTTLPNTGSGDWVLNSGTWKVFDNGVGLAQSWGASTAPLSSCNGRSAYLNRENVADGTFAEDWLVTPLVAVPNNGQLRFTTKQTLAANFGSIYTIRVSTTSQTTAGSFTTVQTWDETELNAVFDECEEKVVSLSAYAGQQIYIAFVMTNDFGDRWVIDDVDVVEQCLDPTAQTATNPTLTGSTLGWGNPSGASQWEVEIVPTGDAPTGTGILTGNNPYTATGLTQGTCYDFYVRAICTSGPSPVNSEWVGPFNFCTAALGETCQSPIVVPDITTGPYITSDDTSGFGDDVSGSPGAGCGTTQPYLNGDDVFYQFTSTTGNAVTVTSLTNSTFSGLFVYSSCANVGVSCVAGTTNGNPATSTPDNLVFTPTIGQTYYIVISTSANPTPQSAEYTLTILENTCTNMTASYAVLTNCPSGTDTFFVTANVTNMGTATSISGTTDPVSTTETITAPGVMQFGPFPNNTPVTINLQNDQDVNCFRNSTVLTQTFCPAPNNLCADAIELNCNTTVSGTTQGSTAVGAPTATCGTASNTSPGVWYTFLGNGDVTTFSLCGSAFDTKMQVLTGACGAFTCVAGNDNFCGTQSEVQIATTIGTLYYIYVYGVNNTTSGTFVLNTTCITPPPPPANDNCDTATVAPVNTDGSCTQITPGTVAGATPSSQANTCVGTADDDVWFSFTATETTHTITLQNVTGSSLDLNHAVYTSTNATNPCDNLTQVLCSNPNLSVVTGLTVGQVYFIRVYTATADLLQDTSFDLCVSVLPPPPPNDSCATPTVAIVNPSIICNSVTPGTISSATASPEPNACTGSADDDVWFTFTATQNIHNLALNNIQGTTTDLAFAVYSGTDCTSLTQVNCQTNNNGVVGGLTPGDVYFIRIYSQPATANLIANFDLCITTPIQCSNAQPFCGDNTEEFVSQTGLPSAGSPGCLGSAPNPVWFEFQVLNSGSITFNLTQTNSATGNPIDVDFILWGPFTDAQMDTNACNSLYDYPDGNTTIPNNIVDCSYSASAFEFIDIPNAIAGQNYLLLVTNFNGAAGTFDLVQAPSSTGSAVCCGVDLGPDVVLCDQTSYTITATTTNDDSIMWFKDNVEIVGQTTNTLTVTETGIYKAEIICGQIGAEDEVSVTFNTSVTPTFDPVPANICINSVAPVLPTTSLEGVTGTWSPATINTSVASTTPVEYVFTPTSGLCANPVNIFVTIDALTVPTFAFNATENICQGLTPPVLPSVSDNGITGDWNPSTIDTSVVGGPVTYTFTPSPSDQCADIYTFNVIIGGVIFTPEFSFPLTYCEGTSANALPDISDNGIVGSWSPSTIDTSVSGTTTSYLFTAQGNQCSEPSVTVNITITEPDIIPTFDPIANICEGESVPQLPSSSTNSPVAITGEWLPPTIDSSNVGTQTFTFRPDSGQCAQEATLTVVIDPKPPVVEIDDSSVCIGSTYELPLLSAGSSYHTQSGGLGDTLTPGSDITINSTQTIYVYAQSIINSNCTRESFFVITAIDSPVVVLDGGCEGSTYTINASVVGGQAVTYEWFDSSGAQIPNQSGSSLEVSQDGTYSCVVTLTTGNQCESEEVFFIADGTLCTIQKGISPNGDGLNENFDLTGLNVRKLEIFNRYGKKVYSFSNYTNQWYGQSDNGNELPSGTYYYVMERDNVEAQSGWIYINR